MMINSRILMAIWHENGEMKIQEPKIRTTSMLTCLNGTTTGFQLFWEWTLQFLLFSIMPVYWLQCIYSLSGKTSYRQMSWSLEAARLGVKVIVSSGNLTGVSAALLPRCLSTSGTIWKVWTLISWLWDFTRSCCKTSYRLMNRDPRTMAK